MSPAQPLAAVLAALAIPVFIAYLHRRRKTPKKVPSAILFRIIAGPQTPTTRSMAKPRHYLSLLLVLLGLAGLVAALTDLQREGEQPRSYIVVLDTSASMGATAVGGADTRLERAVERLGESLGKLGARDRVALVTTGSDTTVRIGLTEDHARVMEIARGLTPQGTSESSAAALRIADAMCRAAEDAQVVLLSDGVGVSAPLTHCPVEHVPIGRIGPNVGITGLAVREADALGLAEVYLAVTADREAEGEIEVALELDGQLVDVVSVNAPASGDAKVLHRIALPPGKRVTARIQNVSGDVLAADDVAWVPRRIGGRVKVLLISTTRLSFTAEALRLHPRVDLTVVGPNDAIPDPTYDLVVMEAVRPVSDLPQAPHVMLLGVPTAPFGIQEKPAAVGPEIVRWSYDDPLFRFVSFDRIQLPEATVYEPAEDQTALVDSDQGTIGVGARHEERDIVALGFSPHASDFVLRVGFVNFVANAVEWAAPPLSERDDADQSYVLAATEARATPPVQIEGTTRGDFSGPVRKDLSVWRLLVWAALGVLAFEWLLPWLAGGVTLVRGRFGRRGRRRPPKREEPKDEEASA